MEGPQLTYTYVRLFQCDSRRLMGLLLGKLNGTANLQMEVLHSGYNSSVDVSQLDSILSSLQPLDFVILVVNPQEARDIWPVSFSQVVLKLKFGIPGHRVR